MIFLGAAEGAAGRGAGVTSCVQSEVSGRRTKAVVGDFDRQGVPRSAYDALLEGQLQRLFATERQKYTAGQVLRRKSRFLWQRAWCPVAEPKQSWVTSIVRES